MSETLRLPKDWAGVLTSDERGMSLRDYFAGQALKSLMSDHAWVRGLDEELMKADRRGPDAFKLALAEHAYRLADAMLVVRELDK